MSASDNDIKVIGFRSGEGNGFSVQLVVSGTPLPDFVAAPDYQWIPYWNLLEGLTTYETDDGLIRTILGVCTCGEYGCGSLSGHLSREYGMVILRDFEGGVTPEGTVLRFDQSNFDSVVAEVVAVAREYDKRQA